MLEKALKLDGKRIAKSQRFKAKRPSEYWLLFFKTYIFPASSSFKFKSIYLVGLIPVLAIILLILVNADSDTFMPVVFVSFFISLFLFIILKSFERHAFVPVQAFQDLAKFIIAIKGDIYKSVVNMRLDYSTIETDKNLLDPYKIGLKKLKGVKYKPYSLERFNAQFLLKDGSICTTALHQISLRVITTKRRSSGKTKTKTKHKHKLFYTLSLKLKTSDYDIASNDNVLKSANNTYEIATRSQGEYHLIKVKYKEKTIVISPVLKSELKHKESIYTEMIQYLSDNKIMILKPKQTL